MKHTARFLQGVGAVIPQWKKTKMIPSVCKSAAQNLDFCLTVLIHPFARYKTLNTLIPCRIQMQCKTTTAEKLF